MNMYNDVLALNSNKPVTLKSISSPIRKALIEEAIKFPSSNDVDKKHYTDLYNCDGYSLCLGKPGKEFFEDKLRHKSGTLGNNMNDMTPTIRLNGEKVNKIGTFSEIFLQFQMTLPDTHALELIACLCVRNAFTLDHKEIGKGIWRYSPPQIIIDELKTSIGNKLGEPIEVFLNYLELIALNEDVKYYTLGHDIYNGAGRQNNLLTYANLIGVLLGKVDFLRFAAGLTFPPTGLNPISIKNAIELFPPLAPKAVSLFG